MVESGEIATAGMIFPDLPSRCPYTCQNVLADPLGAYPELR